MCKCTRVRHSTDHELVRDSQLVRAKEHVCGVNREMRASEKDRETVSVCDRERKKRERENKQSTRKGKK